MDVFETVIKTVKGYNVEAVVHADELQIRNPENGNMISVLKDAYRSEKNHAEYVEYVVCFSSQHRHFDPDEADEISEYVISILNDEVLPIEFYKNGKNRFGGEISKNDFDRLSFTLLTEAFGKYAGDTWLSLEYEINSWSGKRDTEKRKIIEL